MARLMLSLPKIPQPQIGSFQFYTNEIIILTNRLLPYSVIISENDGVLRMILKNEMCIYTKLFVANMLSLHRIAF